MWTCIVEFYESDSYKAMTSFTKLFLLQNDSQHSKNNFVHRSYKLIFSCGWKLTDLLILIHYTSIHIIHVRVFFKRQGHFNILHCWREIIQYFPWHAINISFFSLQNGHFYSMLAISFAVLCYHLILTLMVVVSSNCTYNNCLYDIYT